MQDLKISLLQIDQAWENPSANLDRYGELMSGCQTDLFVLPEMFQTGFSMDTSFAEDMGGPSMKWLKEKSKEHQAAIYTSLMISENENYYNRGVFVEPNGTVNYYDKRKTFGMAKEDEYFEAGKDEVVVNYKDWKFQLQICYDLRFPEIVRNKVHEGAVNYDVSLYVANWPEKRIEHWDSLLRARAIENQSFVIAVNRVGVDGNNFSYVGHSQAIDPAGKFLLKPFNQDGINSVVMRRGEIRSIREMLPFLKDM